MRFKALLLMGMLFIYSVQAFAICEFEEDEFDEWKTKCDAWKIGTGATVVVGTILTTGWYGIGGTVGIAPALVAANSCRIRDEKEQNLKRCYAENAEDKKAALNRTIEEAKKIARDNQVLKDCIVKCTGIYNKIYDNKRKRAAEDHKNNTNSLIQGFIDEGYDINNEDTKHVIADAKVVIDSTLAKALDAIETERLEKIKKITDEHLAHLK